MRTVIVTGARGGIGEVTARKFLELGDRVYGTDLAFDETPHDFIEVICDVTDPDAVSGLVERAVSETGRIDVLVNNAGVAIHNPIPKIRMEDWERNISVNLTGTFVCTQAVFQHMCDRGAGHIINVSSVSGVRGHQNGGAYCASKFGVVGFTEVTDVEGKPFGVKASVVCPGPVDTRMRRENHPDDILEHLTQPEDIAQAVVFLLEQPKEAHTLSMVVRTPLM